MAQNSPAEIINFQPNRDDAPGPDGERAGPFLAEARRKAGISLAAAADATKVKPAHLEAIEAEDFTALPAAPYAVGFVKVYARFLGLDGEAAARQFRADLAAQNPSVVAPSARAASADAVAGEGVRMVSVFAIIAVIVFVFWIMVQLGARPDTPAGNADEEGVRVTLSAAREAAPTPRDAQEILPAPVSAKAITEETFTEATVPAPTGQESAPEAGAPGAAPGDDAAVLDAAPVKKLVHERGDAPIPAADAPADIENASVESNVDSNEPLSAVPVAEIAPSPIVAVRDAGVGAPQDGADALNSAELNAVIDASDAPAMTEAQLLHGPEPAYPESCAEGAAANETVTVAFDITAAGAPANARIARSSNACFNAAAIAAISEWRFDPRRENGAARPASGKQATLNFQQ